MPNRVLEFDLDDPETWIRIESGIVTVGNTGSGLEVRAWGVDGQKDSRGFPSGWRLDRFAERLVDLLSSGDGASIVYVREDPTIVRMFRSVRNLRKRHE